jgi:hypothetical protein
MKLQALIDHYSHVTVAKTNDPIKLHQLPTILALGFTSSLQTTRVTKMLNNPTALMNIQVILTGFNAQ